MTFLELVRKRQSIRSYTDAPVEREKIERCLEAARLAPSACNSQPWYFILVDDAGIRGRIARETIGPVISFNHFSFKAPVLVVGVLEPSNVKARFGNLRQNIRFNLMDFGMAAEHFCLQAAEEGLGTCMLGWFKEEPVKKILNIPHSRKVALIITLGYPEKDDIRPKLRKNIDEIYGENSY